VRASRRGCTPERERALDCRGPVVDASEHMAMQIDHSLLNVTPKPTGPASAEGMMPARR
jgi:hypothetical protein